MNLITHTLLQEKQRIEFMLAKNQAGLEILPKGTNSQKNVAKIYYYLKYMDSKKMISQYIGKEEIHGIREKLTVAVTQRQ